MRISPTSELFKPTGSDQISAPTLKYINARNRQRAYDLVIKEFKRSGISQAMLAKRLNKRTEVICRLLARPSNWGIDTFSELMFGISGALPNFQASYPLETNKVSEAASTATQSRTVTIDAISAENYAYQPRPLSSSDLITFKFSKAA